MADATKSHPQANPRPRPLFSWGDKASDAGTGEWARFVLFESPEFLVRKCQVPSGLAQLTVWTQRYSVAPPWSLFVARTVSPPRN